MDFIKTCSRCNSTFKNYLENLTPKSNGGFHIRGECPNCKKWIKWVPYSESHVVKEALNRFWEATQ